MRRAAGFDHRFGAALAASLAVHAGAMMFSLPAPRLPASEAPAPLEVRLLQPPPPAQELAKSVVQAAKKQMPPRQESAPLARPAAPALQLPAVRDAAEEANEAPAPVSDPVVVPPIAWSVPAPAAVEAPALPPREPALAFELLSGYGREVSEALARYKEYPAIALLRGWQGSVTMRLRVAPSGRLVDAELHLSSGYEVLDRQALAMVTRAGQLPVPPDGLNGGEVAVLVPIVFRLER